MSKRLMEKLIEPINYKLNRYSKSINKNKNLDIELTLVINNYYGMDQG